MAKIAITLIKSPIGYRPEARATVRAIGLRRLHQTIVVPDSESLRGMVSRVSYLVTVASADDVSLASSTRRPTVAISRQSEAKPGTSKTQPKAKTTTSAKRKTSIAAETAATPAALTSASAETGPAPSEEATTETAQVARPSRKGTPPSKETDPDAEAQVAPAETPKEVVKPKRAPRKRTASVKARDAETEESTSDAAGIEERLSPGAAEAEQTEGEAE